ncbi:MAG: transposase [Minisyncoccia bacterium]|jgi:putative transposase
MARKSVFAPGEFYHLYNRGVEKRDIFTSQIDYDRFISLLYLCNSSISTDTRAQGQTLEKAHMVERGETLTDIGVYCLMPNHFHLLVHEKADGGISKFMQKLTTAYTMYFNKKYKHSGALFQGTYKSSHVSEDRYLSYLISYIHLNPVKLIEPAWKETGIADKNRAETYLKKYPYSSYPDYIGTKRIEGNILNKTTLPKYFETALDFRHSLKEWLSYGENGGLTSVH